MPKLPGNKFILKTLQISKFYPPVHGGIESVAFELTEGLNNLGISTDVLCAATGFHTTYEISPQNYAISRAGSLGKVLSTSISPAFIPLTKKLCAQYDLIHLHMPNPMSALALWLTRPRAKLVTHWHSDVVHQMRALKYYEPLQNWILKRSDSIIATSESYLNSSAALQPWRGKVSIIPIGITPIDTTKYSEAGQAIQRQHGYKKIIFSLGRMTSYKGFDTLIDAAHLIGNDSIILVGGSGDLLNQYQLRVAQEGLNKKICFLGRVSDADLAAYFQAASVFCLPSNARSEAFGVVLLEAMAACKPIVATNIAGSGVPWVNLHNVTGINVPTNDARSLADALNMLLSNPALAQRLGATGKLRFNDQFRAQTMVERTASLYRTILPENLK